VEFLRWLANVWSLGVLVVIAGTLLWFVYWVFLRRLWRAKHIANIRLRRMMESREDSEGESGVPWRGLFSFFGAYPAITCGANDWRRWSDWGAVRRSGTFCNRSLMQRVLTGWVGSAKGLLVWGGFYDNDGATHFLNYSNSSPNARLCWGPVISSMDIHCRDGHGQVIHISGWREPSWSDVACLAALLAAPDQGATLERGVVGYCVCLCAFFWIHDPYAYRLDRISAACSDWAFRCQFLGCMEYGLAPAGYPEVERNSALQMAHPIFPAAGSPRFWFRLLLA